MSGSGPDPHSGLGRAFLRHGLRNAAATGAVWPSGRPLVEAMVAPALARPHASAPLRILEVGAGVGPVSSALAHGLRVAGDHLDVVELNPAFCTTLREVVGHHPHVAVHERSVLDHPADAPYDHLVSGLPLANFPEPLARDVLVHLVRLVKPGGTLVNFHHLALRHVLARVPGAQGKRLRALLAMEDRMEPWVVSTTLVPRNVPPARVVVRRRPAGEAAALLGVAGRA